jgi:hypothetical protein
MTRDELIEYRDYLERVRQTLPFASMGRPKKPYRPRPLIYDPQPRWLARRSDFPSETFQILLWALLPWVVTVVVKIWIGDWTV